MDDDVDTRKRCKATSTGGYPCSLYAKDGLDVCGFHTEDGLKRVRSILDDNRMRGTSMKRRNTRRRMQKIDLLPSGRPLGSSGGVLRDSKREASGTV